MKSSVRLKWKDETPVIVDLIAKHTIPGQVFVDVGAHVGQEAIPIASHLGNRGLVWAFEPLEESCRELKRKIERSSITNINVVQLGVLDVPGEVDFFLPSITGSKNDQHATFIEAATVRHAHLSPENKVKRIVQVTTLDMYFQNRHVDFIKIDAQGAEARIIDGMKGLLETCRPKLLMEWEDIEDSMTVKVFNYMKSMNYAVFDINAGLVRVKDCETIFCSAIVRTNLLLIPL